MRRAALTALVVWSGVSGGCTELSELPVGVCGNGAIDDDEDCDGFPVGEKNTPCYGVDADEDKRCRLDCRDPLVCPTGYRCGVDAICRGPEGARFSPLGAPLSVGVDELKIGDFDGNGRRDVLTISSSGLGLYYSTESGFLTQTTSIPIPNLLPAVGDINADGIDDFTLNVGLGLGAFLGNREQSLLPAIFDRFEAIEEEPAVYFALDADPNVFAFGDEIFRLTASKLQQITLGGAGIHEVALPSPLKDGLPLEVPVGNLYDDPLVSPGDEIVVPYPDGVEVFTPYTFVLIKFNWQQSGGFKHVALPEGSTLLRASLADVNHDKHLDIVIVAESKKGDFEIDVAYSDGAGKFTPDAKLAGEDGKAGVYHTITPEKASPSESPLRQAPLALGDVSGDCLLDYVDGNFVYMSIGFPPGPGPGGCGQDSPKLVNYARVATNFGARWTDAVIADFNANGLLDIAVASEQSAEIVFFNGTGTIASTMFKIATAGGVRHLQTGDFDGDLVRDLAFSERSPGGSEESLSVLFGRSAGAPEGPISMGVLGEIQQIIPGNLIEFTLDAATDIGVVVGEKPSIRVPLFNGSGDRLLQSPLVFFRADQDVKMNPLTRVTVPFWSVIGQFDEKGSALDVASLGLEPSVVLDGTEYAETSRLWNVPSFYTANTGETRSSKPLSPTISLPGSRIAAVDLDGDELHEIVGLSGHTRNAPASQQGEVPSLFIAKRVGDTWVISDKDGVLPTEPAFVFAGPLEVVDLNGDKRDDILLLTTEGTVVVLWNEGNGALNLDSRSVIQIPSVDGSTAAATKIRAFASLDTDVDAQPEILLFTEERAHLADFGSASDGKLFTIEPCEIPSKSGVPTKDGLPGEDGGPTGDGPACAGLPGGDAAAAGDIDGDGVDDVVIASPGKVSVYQGTPKLR